MPKKLSLIFFFVFRSECTNKGGTAAGSCASGFGVCCTCKFLLQKNFCSYISRINALICTPFKISHPRLRQHHLREHHLLPVIDVHRSRRPVRRHRLWMQHRCLPGLLSLNYQSLETVFLAARASSDFVSHSFAWTSTPSSSLVRAPWPWVSGCMLEVRCHWRAPSRLVRPLSARQTPSKSPEVREAILLSSAEPTLVTTVSSIQNCFMVNGSEVICNLKQNLC